MFNDTHTHYRLHNNLVNERKIKGHSGKNINARENPGKGIGSIILSM